MGVFAGATPLGRPVNAQFRFPSARGLWAAYCTSLVARPLLTKSSTSLAGFCLGDFIAQQATRRSHRIKDLALEPYDVQRTMRLAFYGGCVAGPIGHYWFNFLDKARLSEAGSLHLACYSVNVTECEYFLVLQAIFPKAATR